MVLLCCEFDPCGIGARSLSGREHLQASSFATTNTAVNSSASCITNNIGDTLGGISKLLVSAVFSVPLPFKDISHKLHNIRAIGYINAGSLGSPDYWVRQHYNSNQRENGNTNAPLPLLGPLRVAAGMGICMNFLNGARMELTYSIPLVKAKHDITRPFQLGLSLTVG